MGQQKQNYKEYYQYRPSNNFAVIDLDSLPWKWRTYRPAVMKHLDDIADYSDNIDLTKFKEAEAALYGRYKWMKYFHFDFSGETYEGSVSVAEESGIITSFELSR